MGEIAKQDMISFSMQWVKRKLVDRLHTRLLVSHHFEGFQGTWSNNVSGLDRDIATRSTVCSL